MNLPNGRLMLMLTATICCLAIASPALSQFKGDCSKPPTMRVFQKQVSGSGPRSSPFDPPEANDHFFVTDGAPFLDTGCIFRSSGPIVFDVEITRVVGDLNSDGTLANAASLVSAGLLSPTATLVMPVFDVDSGAVIDPPFQPEIDRVFFNGNPIGRLSGLNNTWKLNSFTVPIEQVKFAQRAPVGSSPTPAKNEIRIEIDAGNEPIGEEVWCTAVDWAALSFQAISPIILIHGNNSEGGFFDRRGFTDLLRDRLACNQNCPFDNTINFNPASNTIAANAVQLNTLIPARVLRFGADSVHLVVHSKGGLDTRQYLASFQRQHNDEFKVLSYSSLSTPHNGSVLADIQIARQHALAIAQMVDFRGFPAFTGALARLVPMNVGNTELTQAFVSSFNQRTLPQLPREVIYNTVAGDADFNRNGKIERFPNEIAELQDEFGAPGFLSLPFAFAVDRLYKILRDTASVSVSTKIQLVPVGSFLLPLRVATLESEPTQTPQLNDVLVTINSGHGKGTFKQLTTNTLTGIGANGFNHATIANGRAAMTVLDWMIQAERQRGDLR